MGGRFSCLAGSNGVVPSVVFDGEIRACDVGIPCCGGWTLPVDGFSTTDSVGSIVGADGVGLLMVGRTAFFFGLLQWNVFLWAIGLG